MILKKPGSTPVIQLPADMALTPRTVAGDQVVDDLHAKTIRVTQRDTGTTALRIDSAGAGFAANLLELYDFLGVLVGQFTQNGTPRFAQPIWSAQITDANPRVKVDPTDASVNFGDGTNPTDTSIRRLAAGVMQATNILFLPKLAAGTDPAATINGVLLYCVDNGAGKGVLKARFSSGAIQTLATEP